MPSLAFRETRERIRSLVAQDGAVWIWPGEGNKALAEIRSYQDPPMTMDELAYGPRNRTGYQLHHIGLPLSGDPGTLLV